MKIFLTLIAATLFFSCTPKPENFILSVIDEMKSQESLHFKIVEKAYYSNEPDTTVTPYEVWAVRDSKDSVKNGYVWVDNNYRPYNMIYERGNFYLAIPPKQTTILYKDFNESFISDVDWIDYFLNPKKLKELITNPENRTVIADTLFMNRSCVNIEVNLPKSSSGDRRKYVFILDRESHAILFSKMTLETKHYTFFDELIFTDYEINSVNLSELKVRQKKVLLNNPIERDGNNSHLSRLEKMLHVGDKAPLFVGKYYSNKEEFTVNDFVGKGVIVVDFWYTHCHPCVKAMPSLNKLYLKYKDKGLKVFGLNSVDNQPRSIDNLNRFLSKRDISYDIILTQPEVDIMYKINGYPTMYVVDKDGKIAYVEIGFSEEDFGKLVDKVEGLLE